MPDDDVWAFEDLCLRAAQQEEEVVVICKLRNVASESRDVGMRTAGVWLANEPEKSGRRGGHHKGTKLQVGTLCDDTMHAVERARRGYARTVVP